MHEKPPREPHDMDEPVKLPLDPEQAIRGLAAVDPDEPVAQDEPVKDQGDALED